MLQIINQFSKVSGSNDDNILELINTNNEQQVNTISLTINNQAPLTALSTIYLSFSNKTDNDNYKEFLKVALGDIVTIDIPSLVDIVTSYLQMSLLGCTEVYNVKKNGYTITFESKSAINIEVVSSVENNLSLIYLNNEYTSKTITEEELTLYKRNYSYGTNNVDYIINNLVINTSLFDTPIVLKKVNVNDSNKVTFNLRDVFNMVNLNTAIETNMYVTYQECEGIVNEIVPIETVYIIPNSSDNIYNVNYNKYYNDNANIQFDMLTGQLNQNRLVRNKQYSLSYISIDQNEDDILVVELYDKINTLIDSIEYDNWNERGIIRDFNFDTFNMSNISSLKVYVRRGTKIITKPLTFRLYSYCSTIDFKTIFFQNSVGGIDSFNMFNKFTKKLSIGTQETFRGEYKGDRNVSIKTSSKSLTLTTELLTKQEAEIVLEMCRSNNIYYYFNNEKRSIIINKYDYSIDSNTNQYKFEIEIDDIQYIE